MSDRPDAWKPLAKARDISVETTALLVRFPDGRGHRLQVSDNDDSWLLSGLIVKSPPDLSSSDFQIEPSLAAAIRNRRLKLCGIMVNEKGHLVGQCHVPKPGLTAGEFQLHARHLAAECDRLEHLLTGRDRERL